MTERPVPPTPKPATMVFRALTLRCPVCGTGGLFRHWVRIVPRCPTCGFRFDRGEEGYGVGTYMFNLIAAELLLTVIITAIVLTFDLRWTTALERAAIAAMIVMPVLFYPFAKLLFVAFDLCFRPVRKEDVE